MRNTANEIADAVVKVSPPAAVVISDAFLGLTVEKWLTVALLVYTVIQTVIIVSDRLMRRRREADRK